MTKASSFAVTPFADSATGHPLQKERDRVVPALSFPTATSGFHSYPFPGSEQKNDVHFPHLKSVDTLLI
jgi:hypothetical protein